MLGANDRYLIRKVAIPASLPHVFVGLFMGLYYSFAVLVVAEMLGAKYGLGWYIQFQTAYSGYANVYATLHHHGGALLGRRPAALSLPATVSSSGRRASSDAGYRTQAQPIEANALAIEIRGVSHGYDLGGTRLDVLDDVDLAIAPGEFVALLGPSGCGKSTLLRLLAGLEQPTRGAVLADGVPIAKPDPSRILVFQDPTLFPWATVWSNVATGLEARGVLPREAPRIGQALDLVGLAAFANAYPHQLSGGMAQRAALARALVNDPALLLLDEPLGKLDSLTRLTLQQELVSLWRARGFTAILVTHDVEEALLLASRVVLFSDRPASIKSVFDVPKPYPRHRDDPEIVALRRQILAALGLDT